MTASRRLLCLLALAALLAVAAAATDEAIAARTDPIDELLRSVRVDRAISYKMLTLFPVSLRGDYSDFLPRTFDEAVKSGDLTVKEIEGGDVNRVRVKNDGRHPVFIMSGEIMTGSKQDRTAQQDVLVPARSGWIEMPVYCVEAGRWTVVSPSFDTGKAMANPALRSQAYGGAAQGAIWGEVERAASANAVRQSRSKAFQEIHESKEVQARVEDYLAHLPMPQRGRTVGFVAYRGSNAIGADLFGNETLFGRLREKLIRSYVLSVGAASGERVRPPDAEEAAKFVARAWSEHCRRERIKTPGLGQSYRLRNADSATGGGALEYCGETVHMSLFPSVSPGPTPIPVPIPIPRNIQQQQQQR